MQTKSAAPPLPSLEDLGTDLLATTPRQRLWALARPFLGLLAYCVVIRLGGWYVAPILVFLIFVAVVTVTHDIVHRCLGLGQRQTDWALFVMGAFLLESGHAYRATHQQHHRLFPQDDDPEGEPAKHCFWRAILAGPTFLPKLWWWAYRRAQNDPLQRRWLLAEAAFSLIAAAVALVLRQTMPALLFYVALVIVGSWVYPVLTVHLPHRHYGDTPLTQTHTLRGRFIPALFLELTYHLEHHLYPQVPSHNLALLSHRLDPFLEAAGVRPWHVP